MEYAVLGGTGLRVSRLGLGGAGLAGAFGPTGAAEARRVVDEAVDAGVTFIDTAPFYGSGESERRIGDALAGGKRERVVLASKAAMPGMRYTYDETIKSVAASLSRLRTDRIDLMQIHEADIQPYELLFAETLPALRKLQEQGAIRYIGVTGRNTARLARLLRTGEFDTVQAYTRYMLIDTTAADELLPLAARTGKGFINGSALGMGLLAGKPAAFLEPELVAEAERRLGRLDFVRRSPDGSFSEAGMRFSLGNPDVHVTLTGADTGGVLQANVSYCDGAGLPEADVRRLRELAAGRPLFPDMETEGAGWDGV